MLTPEMIFRARETAKKYDYRNVEFRLGEIEHMPIESNSVDLVISNCVLNLVPDKELAFKEIYRVIKPGGKISISDMVATQEGRERNQTGRMGRVHRRSSHLSRVQRDS